jgi:hypothetical protein
MMRNSQGCGKIDPAVATTTIELLADETRLRVLLTLSRRQAEQPADPAVKFAALRRLADVEDSGNFAYHLNRLSGHFITKTDAGYALTDAGRHVASVLHAGVIDRRETPVYETDHECVICGDSITAQATGSGVDFTCESGHGFREMGLPAAVLERGLDHTLREATRQMLSDLETTATGVCARCNHPVEWQLQAVDDSAGSYYVIARCTACAMAYGSPIVGWVIADWDVRAELHVSGLDLLEIPPWSLPTLSVSAPTLIEGDLSADPDQAVFRLTLDLDERFLTVDIDGTATVRSVEEG